MHSVCFKTTFMLVFFLNEIYTSAHSKILLQMLLKNLFDSSVKFFSLFNCILSYQFTMLCWFAMLIVLLFAKW